MEQVIKNDVDVVLLILDTEMPQFSMKQSEIEIKKIIYLTRTRYKILIFENTFLRTQIVYKFVQIVYKLIAISQNKSILENAHFQYIY